MLPRSPSVALGCGSARSSPSCWCVTLPVFQPASARGNFPLASPPATSPSAPRNLETLPTRPAPSYSHPVTFSYPLFHQIACGAIIGAVGDVSAVGVFSWGFFRPNLGEITLDWAKGMTDPARRGPNPSKFTELTIGLSHYADRLYIICTDECDMPVPAELGDNVMMLNGKELDKCNAIEDYSHWIKATQSHLQAITHAQTTDAEVIMILEEDSMGDPSVKWTEGNWLQLNDVLDNRDWNMVRLGYRPFPFESNPGIEACPESCRCEQVGETLCWLQNGGCDLRSSDAYMVHRRAFGEYGSKMFGGTIIDNGVLQGMSRQVFITPQVNYQTHATSDYSSVQHQRDVSAVFMERCQLGMTKTQAAAAMGAAEGTESEGRVALLGDRKTIDAGTIGKFDVGARTFSDMAVGKEMTTEDGRPVKVTSAVEMYGGVGALEQVRRRLKLKY